MFDYLEKLHENYVCIPTDKTSNNISIVCKKFYLKSIRDELNDTFIEVNQSVDDVVKEQFADLKKFNIESLDKCDTLSGFYATCKQHKSPVKFRFITSTTRAVSKPVSKILKNCFKAVQCSERDN